MPGTTCWRSRVGLRQGSSSLTSTAPSCVPLESRMLGEEKRIVSLQGQGQSDFLEDCPSQPPGWDPRMIEGGGVGMGLGGQSDP